MISIKRKLVALVGATSLGAGLLAIAPAVAPAASPVLAPTQAQAFNLGGLDVLNGNRNGRELHVCKQWGWPKGVWHAKSCKSDGSNGAVQQLRPGQRSTQGDTDGIHVPKGYRLERKKPRRGGTYWAVERGCVTNANGWTKVQPSQPIGSVDWFRIEKC